MIGNELGKKWDFSADPCSKTAGWLVPASTKAFAIAEDELGRMVYYNHSEKMLYVLADGTLYRIDLDRNEQEILAENLTEDQYCASDDGHLIFMQRCWC